MHAEISRWAVEPCSFWAGESRHVFSGCTWEGAKHKEMLLIWSINANFSGIQNFHNIQLLKVYSVMALAKFCFCLPVFEVVSSPHGKWHRTFCNKQQSDTGRPREQKDYWIFKHYIEIVKTNVSLSQNLKFKMQNKTGKPVSFPGRWKGRVHPAHMHARMHAHTHGRANTRTVAQTHARTAFLCPTVFANYSLALVVGLKWEKGNRKDAQKWHKNDP